MNNRRGITGKLEAIDREVLTRMANLMAKKSKAKQDSSEQFEGLEFEEALASLEGNPISQAQADSTASLQQKQEGRSQRRTADSSRAKKQTPPPATGEELF